MKIEAQSIEEFFSACGDREELVRKVDKAITDTLPTLKRELLVSSSITMIGYGEMPMNEKSGGVCWPVIGLTPQKQHLSLYVSGMKDEKSIVEWYGQRLGRVSLGKGCIRFSSINNLDLSELQNLLKDAARFDIHASS